MLRLSRTPAAVAAASTLGLAARLRAASPAALSVLQLSRRSGIGAATARVLPSLGAQPLRALSLSAPVARLTVPEEPGSGSKQPQSHPSHDKCPAHDPLPARVEGKRVVVGTDFVDTLADGGFIVDKSLACNALLERTGGVTRICLPRRFGKSFNLSVITQFFNPVTLHDCTADTTGTPDFAAAYKRRRQLFSGSLLQERCPGFFDENFAAIPVIHLDFKDADGESFGAFCKSLAQTLHEAAEFWLAAYDDSGRMVQGVPVEHGLSRDNSTTIKHRLGDDPGRLKHSARRMHESLRRTYLTMDAQLNDGADQWEGRGDLILTLFYNLSKFVAAQHSGKYIILVDEYDSPLKAALDTDWYLDAERRYLGLLSKMFKANKRLKAGLLIGVHEFELSNGHSGLNSVEAVSLTTGRYTTARTRPVHRFYDADRPGPLTDMFAFTRQDVSALVTKTQAEFKDTAGTYSHDDIMATITTWYNGYDFGLGEPRYNPFSVLKFLKSMAEGTAIEDAAAPYWVFSGNTASLARLALRHREEVLELAAPLLADYATKTPDACIRVVGQAGKAECDMPNEGFQRIYLHHTSYPSSRITLNDTNGLVTLLVHLGYLTMGPGNAIRIPNGELAAMWRDAGALVLFGVEGTDDLAKMREKLIRELCSNETGALMECVLLYTRHISNVSLKTHPESVHANLLRNTLGLVFGQDPRVTLVSEQQTGEGRPDLVLLIDPLLDGKNRRVVIIEMKRTDDKLLARIAGPEKAYEKALRLARAEPEPVAREMAVAAAEAKYRKAAARARAKGKDRSASKLEELAMQGLRQIEERKYARAYEGFAGRLDVSIAAAGNIAVEMASRPWRWVGYGRDGPEASTGEEGSSLGWAPLASARRSWGAAESEADDK